MEDAVFNRDRLLEAVLRLGDRLREVKSEEEQGRRLVAYDAALIEQTSLLPNWPKFIRGLPKSWPT
jgi:hypothetical protein